MDEFMRDTVIRAIKKGISSYDVRHIIKAHCLSQSDIFLELVKDENAEQYSQYFDIFNVDAFMRALLNKIHELPIKAVNIIVERITEVDEYNAAKLINFWNKHNISEIPPHLFNIPWKKEALKQINRPFLPKKCLNKCDITTLDGVSEFAIELLSDIYINKLIQEHLRKEIKFPHLEKYRPDLVKYFNEKRLKSISEIIKIPNFIEFLEEFPNVIYYSIFKIDNDILAKLLKIEAIKNCIRKLFQHADKAVCKKMLPFKEMLPLKIDRHIEEYYMHPFIQKTQQNFIDLRNWMKREYHNRLDLMLKWYPFCPNYFESRFTFSEAYMILSICAKYSESKEAFEYFIKNNIFANVFLNDGSRHIIDLLFEKSLISSWDVLPEVTMPKLVIKKLAHCGISPHHNGIIKSKHNSSFRKIRTSQIMKIMEIRGHPMNIQLLVIHWYYQ
jgi:hypothetical protein